MLGLLDAVLAVVPGAQQRQGQRDMASAVDRALRRREHLLVQAGTGTGKSLAYLVPALACGRRVVVATATRALQAQLVDKDLPRVVAALAGPLGRRPTWALAKGRGNYLCLQQAHGGPGAVPEPEGLFERAEPSGLAAEVLRLREWAGSTETGDRDEVPFPVSERAWRQVSVSARDCLGRRCPDLVDCFAEKAREAAREVDVVVANHALLALDAFTGVSVLPEHDVVLLDEAHEFTASATEALTSELGRVDLRRAVTAAGELLGVASRERLQAAADALEVALSGLEPGWLRVLPDDLRDVLALVESAAGAASAEVGREAGTLDEAAVAQRDRARTALGEVAQAAGELRAPSVPSATYAVGEPGSLRLRVSPLGVAGALSARLFGEVTVVATSATLFVGGSAAHTAGALGLTRTLPDEDAPAHRWRDLDVGTPFDPARQGQLWVARELPAATQPGLGPGRRRPARRADRGGGWAHPRAVQLGGGGRPGRGGRARGPARPAGAAAGRRQRRGARAPVRLRRPHLPVRHALVLAGRRHPRQRLPARGHRPDPVRPRRGPARAGPARGRGAVRLPLRHAPAGRRAAGAGGRAAAARRHRPRGGGRARPAAGDGRLRVAAAGHAAAVLPGPLPRGGARLAARDRRQRPAGAPGRTAAVPAPGAALTGPVSAVGAAAGRLGP